MPNISKNPNPRYQSQICYVDPPCVKTCVSVFMCDVDLQFDLIKEAPRSCACHKVTSLQLLLLLYHPRFLGPQKCQERRSSTIRTGLVAGFSEMFLFSEIRNTPLAIANLFTFLIIYLIYFTHCISEMVGGGNMVLTLFEWECSRDVLKDFSFRPL